MKIQIGEYILHSTSKRVRGSKGGPIDCISVYKQTKDIQNNQHYTLVAEYVRGEVEFWFLFDTFVNTGKAAGGSFNLKVALIKENK